MASKFLMASLLSGLSVLPQQALAQEPVTEEAEAEAIGRNDEIIVTANKRSESIQRIPGAVTAISGEDLADRGITDIRGLATQVPNVTFGQQSGAGFISIRGVGTSIDTGLTEPSVAAYIDGVYLSRATMRILQQTDLERVEVLRGPQGTLYGRNATGGAINFISVKPSDRFEAGLTGRIGNFSNVAVDGFVSGPLNEGGTVLARVSAGGERRDGTVKDLANDYPINDIREWHGRAALRFIPADNLTVDLIAQYQHNRSANAYQQILKEVIPIGVLLPVGTNITTDPYRIYTDKKTDADAKTFIGSATLNWDINDDLKFRSITAYVDQKTSVSYDADSTDAAYIVTNFARPVWTFSQELNLYGATGGLDWLVGAFYFHEDFYSDLSPVLPIGVPGAIPAGTSVVRQIEQKTNSFAAFVDLKYALSDQVKVLGGLRYNYEKQSFLQEAIGFNIPGAGFIGDTNVAISDSKSKLLPKIGLEWTFSPRVLAYATYQKGFKSGGLDGSIVNQFYQPEILDAYEVGVKSSFAGGLGTFNVAGFYYEYNDYQIQKFLDAAQTLIENADARVKGVEAELMLRPTERLRLNLAATLLSSKYTRFESVDLLNPGAGPQDLKGNYLNRSPKHSLMGGIDYDVPVDLLGFTTMRLHADAYHAGVSYIGSENNADQRVAPHTIVNASIIFKSDNGIGLRFFVNNLGDETVKQQILYSATQGVYAGSYDLQRTYGAELSFRF